MERKKLCCDMSKEPQDAMVKRTSSACLHRTMEGKSSEMKKNMGTFTQNEILRLNMREEQQWNGV